MYLNIAMIDWLDLKRGILFFRLFYTPIFGQRKGTVIMNIQDTIRWNNHVWLTDGF